MNQGFLLGRICSLFLMLWLCVTASGCWFLVVGSVGAGVVGGYAITRDTFEGITNKTQDELVDASQKVLEIMGRVTLAYPKSGEIEALVNGVRVKVTVVQINVNTSKLRVKARNGIFPRIGVAQEVYTKIMNQLAK